MRTRLVSAMMVLLIPAHLFSGCSTRQTTARFGIQRGEDVEVHFRGAQDVQLTAGGDAGRTVRNVAMIHGRFHSVTWDSVRLTRVATVYAGGERLGAYEAASFDYSADATFWVSRVDTRRTALLLGGAAAAALVLLIRSMDVRGFGGGLR
jgi:hypothetical protein